MVVIVLSVFTTANLGPPCLPPLWCAPVAVGGLQTSDERTPCPSRILQIPHSQNRKGVRSGELLGRGMGPAYAVGLPRNIPSK